MTHITGLLENSYYVDYYFSNYTEVCDAKFNTVVCRSPNNVNTQQPQWSMLFIGMHVSLASWPRNKPKMFERGQGRLMVLGDITCDAHGSVEFLERTTTIDQPFFQYDPTIDC